LAIYKIAYKLFFRIEIKCVQFAKT